MRVLTETRRRQFLNMEKGRPMNEMNIPRVVIKKVEPKKPYRHTKFNFGNFNTKSIATRKGLNDA